MKLEATQVNGSRGYGDIFIYTHQGRGGKKLLPWVEITVVGSGGVFVFFLAMYILDSFSWMEYPQYRVMNHCGVAACETRH